MIKKKGGTPSKIKEKEKNRKKNNKRKKKAIRE